MDYDVIIIGGGPNGETVGAYLAKAGAKVLIVERRDEMGGGLVTEDIGGFRFNFHATYSMMGDIAPPVRDLFLAQYGCRFYRPPEQLHVAPSGGKSLTVFDDAKKTAKAIGRISKKDEGAFSRLHKDLVEVNEKIIIPWHYTAPAPPDAYREMLGRNATGRKLLRLMELSPRQILDEYGLEDDTVRGAVLYPGCVWGPDPDQKGVGQMFAFFVYRMTRASLVSGGSHRYSSSLLRSYYVNGGDVLEDMVVTKILVEDGRATGVALDNGQQVMSQVVVSTLNPTMTFLELVGEDHLPKDLARKVRAWKWDEWSMFMVHMGVRNPPVYRSTDGTGTHGVLLQLIGYEGEEDIVAHWKDCRRDRLPSAAGGWTTTSEIDPTQAPDGFHVVRMETQVPYEVRGKDWHELKEEYGKMCIDGWLASIENPERVDIRKTFLYPPTYIEGKLPEMHRGSIRHGAYIPEQMGYFRPHESCSGTRTPIENLYVAGASVHPGGMVTLGPGYVAANAIAKDLGLRTWWRPPDFLMKARKAGFATPG